jgi:hypothetical protein
VKEKLTDALKLQQDGYSIAPQNQTVGQFLNYWLDHVIPNATKPKTASVYRYITTIHLIPSIGKIQIQKLTAQHVQALINEKLVCLKQSRKKTVKTPYGATAGEGPTVMPKLSDRSVSTALEVAVKHAAVQRDVAMPVDPPRVPKAEMKFLTLDQALTVLAAASGRFQERVHVRLSPWLPGLPPAESNRQRTDRNP